MGNLQLHQCAFGLLQKCCRTPRRLGLMVLLLGAVDSVAAVIVVVVAAVVDELSHPVLSGLGMASVYHVCSSCRQFN